MSSKQPVDSQTGMWKFGRKMMRTNLGHFQLAKHYVVLSKIREIWEL